MSKWKPTIEPLTRHSAEMAEAEATIERLQRKCDELSELVHVVRAETQRCEDMDTLLADDRRHWVRLAGLLDRVAADVELWAVTGRHRTCMCPACEDLRDIAEAVGGV